MRKANRLSIVACLAMLLLLSSNTFIHADEAVEFEPGFNLFSYPVDVAGDYSAYDLIQDLNSNGQAASIQRFNPDTGQFETCVWDNGNAAGVDFPIINQEGYIVHVSGSAFDYSFTGGRNCQSVSLREGFNISSFPCPPVDYTSYQLMDDLGSEFVINIKSYDHTTGTMLQSFWDGSTPSGEDFDVLHGAAYLVEMSQETTWTPGLIPSPPLSVTAYDGNNQVILIWDEPEVLNGGYNIYRSTTQGGSYGKINDFLETQTNYTDYNVSNGNTYYYVVTAVNQYGMESDDSDEVSATPAAGGPTIIDTDISSDTIWSLANSPYIVANSIQVTNGTSLTIEPGVEVRYDTGHLEVEGTLTAIGTSSNPIIFKSNNTSPTLGDWTGIQFIGSGSSLSKLEYCRIEHAVTGIYCEDSSPEISHCEIVGEQVNVSADYYGIYLLRSNAYIHDCNISNFLNDSGNWARAIFMWESSPVVEDNDIVNNEYAIHICFEGDAQILNNTIEDFRKIGIYCDGYYRTTNAPFPVINNNTIRTIYNYSDTYGIYVYRYGSSPGDPALVIDAKDNYWGTTLPEEIAAFIYDWAEHTGAPHVDFRGFLDNPGGSAVTGHYIPAGQLPANELTWTEAQGPYIVLGNAFVGAGQILTIQPGTEVRFMGGTAGPQERWVRAALRVDGKLDAQGIEGNEILFTSHEASPVQGDWESIIFNESADDTSIISCSRVEYAYNGIWCVGASPTISHNEIVGVPGGYNYDIFNGLRLESGCQSVVEHNTISGFHNTYNPGSNGGRGIRIFNASPTITSNVLDENSFGIVIEVNWLTPIDVDPTITGNDILNSRYSSLWIYGDWNETRDPQPHINNNSVTTSYTDNNYMHVRTWNYQNAEYAVVDCKSNWWGTTDPEEIGALIYDWNENSGSPVVDFKGYLDDAGGSPVPGTQIHAGALTGTDLNWTAANSPYLILGRPKVAAGDTLTIEAGTELLFANASEVWDLRALEVQGIVTAMGTSSSPIIFNSNRSLPTLGDWTGIRFIGADSSGSTLEYCRIEHAATGIYCEDSSPEISHCEIVGEQVNVPADYYGIYLKRSNAYIHDCNISNFLNDSGNWARAIFMQESSPLVEDNDIVNNEYAIHIYLGGDAQIFNNTIEDFWKVGIYCDGNYQTTNAPFPVINNNIIQTIYDFSDTYNLLAQRYAISASTTDPSLVIDVRNNYWGTTSPEEISAMIYQWPSGNNASPFVDFRGFLDGPGGSAVPGHYISDGQLPATEVSWTVAQGPYIVLGNAFVGSGQTLTIEPGTEVRFIGNKVVVGGQDRWVRGALRVDGKLDARGTVGNEILFTSHESSPVQGDWEAIVFNEAADDTSIISYSRVEYAFNGIWCTGASPTISYNEIVGVPGDYHYDIFYGMRLESGCESLVGHNTISGFHNTYNPWANGGRGIYIFNASPTITSNVLDENSFGIVIEVNWLTPIDVNPTITGNSILNSYECSFYIKGDWDDIRNPEPIINNNNIFSDYDEQNSFYTLNYGGLSTISINAENNWWGVLTSGEINAIIYDNSDHSYSPIVDYSSYLSSDIGDFVLYGITLDDDYFSPNDDGEQDSVAITGSAIGGVTWTITIKDATGTVVRTYIGSLPWTWDGKDNGSVVCQDGVYTIIVQRSDGGSTTITRTLTTRIDTSMIDTLSIDSPGDGVTTFDSFEVACTVNDVNLMSYTLEIGLGSTPSSWLRVAGMNDGAWGTHPGTHPIFNDTLYTWVSNETETDTIPQWGGITFDNGPYSIRLTATDRAGNNRVETSDITLDNLFITDVSRTSSTISPENSETAEIQFTVNKSSQVTMKIYPEWEGESGGLIREITQSLAAGTHSISWDGKDTQGEIVPNEAYIYVLEASGGGRTDKYLPVTGHVDGSGEGIIPSEYNFYTNDFWKIDYSMSTNYPAGRVSMEVTPYGESTFRVLDMEPHDAEEMFTILWDGRRPNGTLVETPSSYIYFPPPTTLRPNYVIVKSTPETPVISGQAPHVEVKADPYLVNFCYGEQTKLLYNIDRHADVTIKILPPGVTDPASPIAIILVDNETQTAGDNTISWDGIDIGDPRNILLEDEGVHTFIIEATASGKTTTWKGVLNLYR